MSLEIAMALHLLVCTSNIACLTSTDHRGRRLYTSTMHLQQSNDEFYGHFQRSAI